MKDQNKIKEVAIAFQGQFLVVSVPHFWNSHREGSERGDRKLLGALQREAWNLVLAPRKKTLRKKM